MGTSSLAFLLDVDYVDSKDGNTRIGNDTVGTKMEDNTLLVLTISSGAAGRKFQRLYVGKSRDQTLSATKPKNCVQPIRVKIR